MLKIGWKSVLSLIASCLLITVFSGCAKKVVVKPVKPVEQIIETPKETTEEPTLRGKEYKKVADLGTVYFEYDDAALSASARDILSNNAKWLKENPDVEIVIEGHCDERGTTDYNIALGDRRAKSVRSYLMKLGIKGNRIATISYGEEKPADFGHDENAWAKNRRSETLGRIPPK